MPRQEDDFFDSFLPGDEYPIPDEKGQGDAPIDEGGGVKIGGIEKQPKILPPTAEPGGIAGPAANDTPEVQASGGPLGPLIPQDNRTPEDKAKSTVAPTGAYLQSLIASGMDPQAAIAQFNKETGRVTGNEAQYYGPEVHGVPTIGLPGEYLDFKGGKWNVNQRVPEVQAAGGQPSAGGQSLQDMIMRAYGGAPQQQQGGGTFEALLQQLIDQGSNKNQAFDDNIRSGITDTLARYSKDPSENDPEIQGPTTAYHNEAERSRRAMQEKLAERRAANGLPSGAFDAALEGGFEDVGRNTGNYKAGLLGDAFKQKRDALMQSLQLGAGLLSGDEQRSLQSQIASMDAMIRKNSSDNALELGRGSLANQLLGLNNSFSLGQGSLANQRQSIGNQNQQFYDQFGYNMGRDANNNDNSLLALLLGGLGG